MNKNKILIELYIPSIEKTYDLYIPINKKIGTVKTLIEKALVEITEDFGYIIVKGKASLIKLMSDKQNHE